MPVEVDRFARQQVWARRATVAALASFLFLGGALVQHYVFDEPPLPLWDPLGVYPEQIIASPQPISVGGIVEVVGVKCVRRSERRPVRVAGELGWQLVDPRDGTYGVALGQSFRYPAGTRPRAPAPLPAADGCTTYVFKNPMPAEVAKISRQLLTTNPEIVWRLVGRETPIRKDGTRGEIREFVSGPIRVVR